MTAVPLEPAWATRTVDGCEVTTATIALPGVPRGGVVVLSAPEQTRSDVVDVANRLAAHGYEAVSLTGVECPTGSLVGAGLDALRERGWEAEQTAVLGFGPGADAVAEVLAALRIGAAVGVETSADALCRLRTAALLTPWLGLARATEPGVDHSALRTSLRQHAAVHTDYVVYDSANQAVWRRGNSPAQNWAHWDHWQRVVEWFNARIVPRPTPLARRFAERAGAR